MESVSCFEILLEVIFFLVHVNAIGKGINPSFLSLSLSLSLSFLSLSLSVSLAMDK